MGQFALHLAVVAAEIHVDDAVLDGLLLPFGGLPLSLFDLLGLVLLALEPALVLAGLLEGVLLLAVVAGVVEVQDVLETVLEFLVPDHAIEEFEVGDDAFEALVPALEDAPPLHALDLSHGAEGEAGEELLELLLGAAVEEVLLEEGAQFLLVGVLDEFVEALAVEVQQDLAVVLLVDAVLEGGDEGEGLGEVPAQQDLLEELDLAAVADQLDLRRPTRT